MKRIKNILRYPQKHQLERRSQDPLVIFLEDAKLKLKDKEKDLNRLVLNCRGIPINTLNKFVIKSLEARKPIALFWWFIFQYKKGIDRSDETYYNNSRGE